MGTGLSLSIAILTWNRKDLFLRTHRSLVNQAGEFELCVLDQGSTDGTEAIVQSLGRFATGDGNTSFGHGLNRGVAMALECRPDIVFFTADDYEYKPDALQRLMAFWEDAPAKVALTCCNLEHEYPWNAVRGVLEAGNERALVRDTVPGGNWSFRAQDWPIIGPIREVTGQGEDLEVCHRLTAAGYKLCELDLAEHIGERLSTWGNRSWQYAVPLDREKWGL